MIETAAVDNMIFIKPIEIEGKAVGFPEDVRKRFFCKVDGKPYVWEDPRIKLVKYDGVPSHMVTLEGRGSYMNRRQAYRQYIGEEMSVTITKQDGSKETLLVLVKDISETGAGFLTDRELHEGDAIRLRIKKNDEIMKIKGKIVRTQTSDEIRGTLYGCKFTDIVPKLSQYIMEIQREKLKSSRSAPVSRRKDGKK